MLALYLNPASAGDIAGWLNLPGEDQAILLDPEPGVSHRVLPWASVLARAGDTELVHLPSGATPDEDALRDLPSPLLTAPALALPAALGSRVALSVADRGHAVLLSRQRAPLAAALDGFLRSLLRASLSGPVDPPRFGPRTLAPLLEPLSADSWFTFHFQVQRRYWTLDAQRHGGAEGSIRWVCEGAEGRWREGWTWASASR